MFYPPYDVKDEGTNPECQVSFKVRETGIKYVWENGSEGGSGKLSPDWFTSVTRHDMGESDRGQTRLEGQFRCPWMQNSTKSLRGVSSTLLHRSSRRSASVVGCTVYIMS